MTRQERYSAVIAWFEAHMPVAETELHYSSPFELLVAVILSAQCTDKRVNLVTPELFARYPSPYHLAAATEDEVFDYVRSISYPRAKAGYLVRMAQLLVSDYHGIVPEEREDLMRLPGVGRKTANVISSVIYDRPAMAVDTHVFRVANRLGLTTNSKTPLSTEETLVRYIPPALIPKAHHWLILHGRYVCTARAPQCARCGLAPLCRYFATQEKKRARTLSPSSPL